MGDLFSEPHEAPFAEEMRPRSLNDVVGQSHLLGPGKPLRRAFDMKRPHSMILWGPPGVGKTTLARLTADAFGYEFIALSAVLSGVKEIREAILQAQVNAAREKKTILFIDEIHRFNKSQQDSLLPHVESGLFTLIGATTEHPGMEVNGALLSRSQVYSLEPLSASEMRQLYERSLPHLKGVSIDDEAIALLTGFADGDGRRFLNLIDLVATAAVGTNIKVVTEELAMSSAQPSVRRFDKGGDQMHWQLSAFHKSLRSSQPDAALYWMARMIDGGGDARQVVRRMIVVASEDIGNADPRALQLAINAAEAWERLGAPEGELALAQAATYLAMAAKSNASYLAWKQAKAFVQQDGSRPVPMHLRNAPTKLAEQMGYKQNYRYAHDEPNAYAAGQSCMPDGMDAPNWYRPVQRGLEIQIGNKLNLLHGLDDEAVKKTP